MPQSLSDPETWVDVYGDMLYAYALKLVSNQAVARDLVQETFLAALKSRQSFKRRSHEKTWFFGILKHKIFDYLRHKYRRTPWPDDTGMGETMEAFFDPATDQLKKMPAPWQATPSDLLEKDEFWATLHSCLSQLPEKARDAFKLRELEGESTETICKVLDITPTNLWVMLYRARLLLRRCLEKNWFEREKG